VRGHVRATSLALTAPCDQLLLATEMNEWALCATLIELDPPRWSYLEHALIEEALRVAEGTTNPAAEPLPCIAETAAFARFEVLSSREANPGLLSLLDAAATRGLPQVLDESTLTLGAGTGARSFDRTALPAVADVAWDYLHGIPTAIVTGSNGKTTTVRLLAACIRAHGWHVGYTCTDGVFLDDEPLAGGDYSGPSGSRWVMREPRAQAAVLETARGGILRRGIAVSQAQVAVITNVSPDHFGEYGIDDLAGVAEVKFVVAAALTPTGLLVLNADDPHLHAQARGLAARFGHVPRLGWFSVNPDPAVLQAHRVAGAPVCGVRAGRLYLRDDQGHGGVNINVDTSVGVEHDLGPIAAMPLSMAASAHYNVANMAGAALAAAALGIAPSTIAAVLSQFGSRLDDNPGRMMRFDRGGVTVLVDYAHNAEGLRGFLDVATRLRLGRGRLGLLLGQAGNRKDEDLVHLATVVAEFTPDLIVIKENELQLRGRAPGDVPRILRTALQRLGFPDSALPLADSELEAARHALEWARPGDVLALPVHSSIARAAVVALLKEH